MEVDIFFRLNSWIDAVGIGYPTNINIQPQPRRGTFYYVLRWKKNIFEPESPGDEMHISLSYCDMKQEYEYFQGQSSSDDWHWTESYTIKPEKFSSFDFKHYTESLGWFDEDRSIVD